jgi:hypothetical protein
MTTIEQIYIKHKKKQKKNAISKALGEGLEESRKVLNENHFGIVGPMLSIIEQEKTVLACNAIAGQPIILPKDRKNCFIIPGNRDKNESLLKVIGNKNE